MSLNCKRRYRYAPIPIDVYFVPLDLPIINGRIVCLAYGGQEFGQGYNGEYFICVADDLTEECPNLTVGKTYLSKRPDKEDVVVISTYIHQEQEFVLVVPQSEADNKDFKPTIYTLDQFSNVYEIN